MCIFDRKTGRKVSDCESCGCGQSKNWGNHDKNKASDRCKKCGLY